MSKPFIKYVGGKTQLLPELRKHIPAFRRYYEPFVGGGALFFDLEPSVAALGDQNSRLISMYKAVRDSVEEVIALLKTYPFEKTFYLAMRARDIDDIATYSTVEVAAWFIYLNKTCYNGMYRVNKSGGFNVPMGKYTNPVICDAEALRACSEALKGTTLTMGDFEQTTAGARAGDFAYFDPPYVPVPDTADFTAYTSEGFGHKEQLRLRDHAISLVSRGVHVVLSNSDTPPVRELYKAKPFTLHEVKARRSVNSKAGKRGPVGELIITTEKA